MHAVILGAGISGLASAYYLRQQHPDWKLTLLEKDSRVGGKIHTVVQDGYLFEFGPRSIRPKGAGVHVIELAQELGLESEILLPEAVAKKRYLYLNGKLTKVPNHPLKLLLSPAAQGWWQAMRRDWSVKAGPRPDESVEAFCLRHFGRTVTENLIDPFMTGIRCGDMSRLSVQASLPSFSRLEAQYGSLIKGFFKERSRSTSVDRKNAVYQADLISFKHGLGQLVQALTDRLASKLKINTAVQKIEKNQGGFCLMLSTQQTLECDLIISTIPSHQLSGIVMDMAPALASALQKILYAPIAVVSLAYAKKAHDYQGFGYLVPHKEGQDILGVSWNEQSFRQHAPADSNVLSVMIGGPRFKNFHVYRENNFIDMALKAARTHMGITQKPAIQQCRILTHALPQYNLGHNQIVQDIRRHTPKNFYVLGNFIDGVGIPDIVRNAKNFCAQLKVDNVSAPQDKMLEPVHS